MGRGRCKNTSHNITSNIWRNSQNLTTAPLSHPPCMTENTDQLRSSQIFPLLMLVFIGFRQGLSCISRMSIINQLSISCGSQQTCGHICVSVCVCVCVSVANEAVIITCTLHRISRLRKWCECVCVMSRSRDCGRFAFGTINHTYIIAKPTKG